MYQLDLNIFNLIIIASVFVGLTFGLLLIFTKRVNKRANMFLGILALVIVLWNIWVLSLDLNIFRYYPKFYLIPLNFSLALGPSLYLYTKRMTSIQSKSHSRDWMHYLPLLFELSVHVLMIRQALSLGVLATDTDLFYTLSPIVQLFNIISIVWYSLMSLRCIRTYHSWLKKNYSNDRKYSLRWLYRLVLIFGLMWLMLVPYTFVDYLVYDFQLGIHDYYPMYIMLSLIAIWISAEAFLKPEIILLEAKEAPVLQELKETKNKPGEQVIKKAKWLKDEMESNLFYLDPELSLRTLAREIDVHPNDLSRIINEGHQKNFSDFVNEYRANAVIERLKDPKYENITLLGISFDCGFNSKTTFNRVFKNMTGKTPFEYKKTLR